MATEASQPVGPETRPSEAVVPAHSHEEHYDAAGVRENRDPQKRASKAPSNSSRQTSSKNSQKSTKSTESDGNDRRDRGGGDDSDDSDGEDDRRGKSHGGKGAARTDGRTDLDRNVAVNQAGFSKNNKG